MVCWYTDNPSLPAVGGQLCDGFMRATYIYGAGDIRVETVADPELLLPTDAIVRVTRACICGSDLHPYHSKPASEHGTTIGHEFIGVVEEIGSDVATLGVGDFVIAPFAWSDGTCAFCREGLQTSCEQGGFWNMPGSRSAADRQRRSAFPSLTAPW